MLAPSTVRPRSLQCRILGPRRPPSLGTPVPPAGRKPILEHVVVHVLCCTVCSLRRCPRGLQKEDYPLSLFSEVFTFTGTGWCPAACQPQQDPSRGQPAGRKELWRPRMPHRWAALTTPVTAALPHSRPCMRQRMGAAPRGSPSIAGPRSPASRSFGVLHPHTVGAPAWCAENASC